MNAYLIAAKAMAFEVDQHVGRAVDARQSERETEALGFGAGSVNHDKALRRARLFSMFRAA